jgi:hypothetical protein
MSVEADKALHPPVVPPGSAGRSGRLKGWLMTPAVLVRGLTFGAVK